MLIHESSPIKGRYTLGIVESVKTSQDGLVRSCVVGYRIPSSRDSIEKYSGGKKVTVTRSVQRLSLLLPIEEQSEKLVVNGDQIAVES